MAIPDPPLAWRRSLSALLLVAYLVAMPIQFEWGTYRQIAPADLVIAVYLLVRLPRLRHVPAAWSTWHYALLPLLAFGMLVALVHTGEVTSYAWLQKGVGLLVLLATSACVADAARDWARLHWLLSAFVGAVVLHASVALAAQVLGYLGGPTVPLVNDPFPGERISGLVLDANAFGGLTALAFMLHHLTAGTPAALLRGGWAWYAWVVLPATLLLTFSRSAWLGLAAGLLVITVLWPRTGARALLRVVVPATLLVPVVLLQIPDSAELVTRPSQIASRLVIGAEAIDGFLAHPLTGIGLGGYVARYGIVVHNTALWFLSDLGPLGLAVFLGLVLTVAARLVAARRLAPPEAAALPLALFGGHAVMVGVSMGIEAFYQRHWWIVLGAAGAAYALARAPDRDVVVR